MLHESIYKDEFEQLFKENYNRLYFYVLNLVKDQEEARDIVSNSFEYVWNNYNTLKSSASITPLLYTLARNKCIDHLRHQETIDKYYKHISQEEILWEEDAYSEREEQIARIGTIIESLPQQTKKVVRKCFLEGKKYKEVAEEMNITTNTVKSHIMKAFRIFRSEFRIQK